MLAKTPLPPAMADKIAKALERHLQDTTRHRLANWGRWWHRDNQLQIDRSTGQIRTSPSGTLMANAPVRANTGYWHDAPAPIDEADALALHQQIITLPPIQRRALAAHYAERAASTTAQRQARHRAIHTLTFTTPGC
ncbi:hypothetical protein VSS37_10270 [Candidatus Thiothrix sp. Deng01]|uniref:Uncharacterized protein n=1 Tax=Candidatus Thiothrix phosphatis TaxID=3112415 RepID=A0ABU6CZ49_9GAMM|nr:hypothetical protein [Candidatus Thiothrix sp. Deng01]MEB4591364.1 hypothetical protein [Candidatus Thiothrix sp. Deng01]